MEKQTPHSVGNEDPTSTQVSVSGIATETASSRAVLWATLQEVVIELTLEYAEEMRNDAHAPPNENEFEHADTLAEIARIAEREQDGSDGPRESVEVEVYVQSK